MKEEFCLSEKRRKITNKLFIYKSQDVKEFLKELKEGFNKDWEVCKKANCEPHIHPRRVIEFIDKLAREELVK